MFPEGKKLYRSRGDKRLAGVCGGIGAYFKVDSNIIRIFWTLATLGSFGFGVLAYLILAIYLTEAE
ncbi:MAG: PspC domain-containing protein, partial [Candidatus Marinimicrobia bacterium]|nr:PspC domain-containing protein [Candidatus Neomarinimicrobiota bacterium]